MRIIQAFSGHRNYQNPLRFVTIVVDNSRFRVLVYTHVNTIAKILKLDSECTVHNDNKK